MTEIEKWHRISYLCAHCRVCTVANYHQLRTVVPICPSGTYFGFESYFAPGRIELVRGFNEGIIKQQTDTLLRVVYGCTSCGACTAMCKGFTRLGAEAQDYQNIFEDLRAHLVELGWGPMPSQAKFAQSVQVNHNPYQEPHEERFAWLSDGLPKEAETVYFTGCTASYRRQAIAKSTVQALKAAGIPFAILGGEEWCCGSPLLRTGQRKLITELAKHNVEEIRKLGAKRLITSCAGCYRTIKENYKKILGSKLDFEVIHSTELFSSLINEKKLKPSKRINLVATYHDPCHLGRHMGVYEPPRNVLRNIPGIKLIEMLRNQDNSWCCGAGGGVKSGFPDFALWTAGERLKDVEETGVKAIVSACPFCKTNLLDAVKAFKKPFEVYDVMEIVSKAIG